MKVSRKKINEVITLVKEIEKLTGKKIIFEDYDEHNHKGRTVISKKTTPIEGGGTNTHYNYAPENAIQKIKRYISNYLNQFKHEENPRNPAVEKMEQMLRDAG